jgi:hypothetical protein
VKKYRKTKGIKIVKKVINGRLMIIERRDTSLPLKKANTK